MTRDHEVLSFGELLTEEHGFISTVRKSAGSSNGGNEYVGLAMSGGGVRSAIFQVGVLQALATAHYLPQIDYISAVSGGGYACAWLVKWLKSSGDYSHVLESLASPFPRRQSERITWLRRYSNYLTPRVGPFTEDSLLFATTYAHHFLYNLIVLIFAFAFLLFVPRVGLGLLFRFRSTPTAFEIIGGSLAFGSALLVLRRILHDGIQPQPFARRRHVATVCVLSALAYFIPAHSHFLSSAVACLAIAVFLSRSRRLPTIATLRRLVLSTWQVLSPLLRTAADGTLSSRLRQVADALRHLLTQRRAHALLSVIVLLGLGNLIDVTDLAPQWLYIVVFGGCWALPVDSWFEAGSSSRAGRRHALVWPAVLASFAITAYMFYRPDVSLLQKHWIRFGGITQLIGRYSAEIPLVLLLIATLALLTTVALSRYEVAARYLQIVEPVWSEIRYPFNHLLAATGVITLASTFVLLYPVVPR